MTAAAMPPSFHHLGLAVRSPKRARAFLESLGYAIGEPVHDPLQGVHLAMAEHSAMPRVEIVWTTSAGDSPSPLDAYLRASEGLVYHLCYEVDDAELTLETFRKAGSAIRCVAPSKPAVLFGGRHVSFHLVAGVGLIELLDRAETPS
jgi:catechol 2,3-dioxygenase-like lactoylglutathione lyase family enzyme